MASKGFSVDERGVPGRSSNLLSLGEIPLFMFCLKTGMCTIFVERRVYMSY